MSTGNVRVERREGCGIVTVDREPLNILDRALMRELGEAVAGLGRDPALHLLALRGAGRGFSAGADVAEHLPPDVDSMLATLRHLLLAVADVPIPTLAAIHGVCLGGGLELALAADRRIATADARLGNPEIQLGVIAPAAAVLLPDIIGAGPALHLLATGDDVTAQRALDLGLVDQLVAPDGLDAAIAAEAAALARRSRSALVATKKAVRFGASALDLRDRLEAAESLYLSDVANSPDGLAGLRAFLSKRKRGA